MASDITKEENLGLDNLSEAIFKSGRFWAAMTSWKEPKTGTELKIITAKSEEGH